MKYCRFQAKDAPSYGLVETTAGEDVVTRLLLNPPEAAGGDLQGVPSKRMDPIPLAQAVLFAPVQPSKVVCVGRNYREHASELGNDVPQEPLLFLKPPSSLISPGASILRPRLSQRVDHEGELGVVIGKRCHKPGPEEDMRRYILGYTCINDVTARDLQKKDGQWTRAKGFDTFCPVGPLVTDEIDPWAGVAVETRVNGEVRQRGNTHDFVFALEVVIRHIAYVMTLLPGDLIATGTPSGVGPLLAGDVVEIQVAGIGVLRNPVSEE